MINYRSIFKSDTVLISVSSSHEREVLKVSYWDQSMSVVHPVSSCVVNNLLETPPLPLDQF